MSQFKVKQLGNASGLDTEEVSTSFLIKLDKSEYMLFDCGYNVLTELKKLEATTEFNIADIKLVYISHMHEDHIGNLQALIFHNYFINNKKTSIVTGIDGLDDYLRITDGIFKSSERYSNIKYTLTRLYDPRRYDTNNSRFFLCPTPTNHGTTPCAGVLVYNKTGLIAFSGDTKAICALEELVNKTIDNKLFLEDITVYHDFSEYGSVSNSVHAVKDDIESEYTPEFISRIKYIHDGTPVADKDWV